ncbi:uncharacterized protein LOC119665368, partial [Teleopsis dalmanni]|uniref:uncharacterized protein LOC119665368 n=1 Tax=Teleopsis dalmanni TaxID=139649 RepID=UPI0018CF5F9E
MSLTASEMKTMMESLAGAIRMAVTEAVAVNNLTNSNASSMTSKPPPFKIAEFKLGEGSSVQDYFTRMDWALNLSKIPEAEQGEYVRVYMGAELNDALKILASPTDMFTYNEIKNMLIHHFDGTRNKQEKGESISKFVLRLKEGARFCEYEDFLDRMLVEQLLYGVESRNICDEIVIRKPKNFTEAYEIAHTIERAQKTTTDVKGTELGQPSEPTYKLGCAPIKTKRNFSENHEKAMRMTKEKTVNCYGCGGQHFRKEYQIAEDDPEPVQQILGINALKAAVGRMMVHVKIDGKEIQMELDTGAPCAVISYRTLRSIRPNCKLLKSDRRFTSYTGHKVNCVGRIVVSASVGKIVRRLSLYVVEGDCDTLCGREWISQFARENNFSEFFSSSNHINSINSSERELSTNQRERLQQLIERFKNVFSETAGKLSGPPAKVHLKKGATPVFARPREVPMALKDAYGKEIDRKIQLGHYKRVDHSEWASITHIVAKKNGGIRITGNYKPTVNPQMIIDEHPIPKAEDLFNKMKNATIFCHLDVTDAYTHLTIDEEFAHVLTLNTITHG